MPAGHANEQGELPCAVDDRLLRHGLREGDVGRAAGDQVRVELVRHGDRAGGLALLAAGAGVDVHEPRLRVTFAVKVPSARVWIWSTWL